MTERTRTNAPQPPEPAMGERRPVPAASAFWRFAPWALAALFAMLAAWAAQRSFMTQTEADLRRQQQALVELALQSTRQQLEAERILNQRQIASLVEHAKTPAAIGHLQIALLTDVNHRAAGATAVAVWDPVKQQGVVAMENPPQLAAGEALELWLVGADGKTISAGMLELSSDGRMSFRPSTPTALVTAVAISRERADGVKFHERPTGEILRGALR